MTLHDWADTAPVEDASKRWQVRAPERQISICVDDRTHPSGKRRESIELEMAFDDDPVGSVTADRLPNVPQSGRPDLAVGVLVRSPAVVETLERTDGGNAPNVGRRWS